MHTHKMGKLLITVLKYKNFTVEMESQFDSIINWPTKARLALDYYISNIT